MLGSKLCFRLRAQSWLCQNNANEGAQFTPQNIVTTSDFLAYIERYFANFSTSDIAKVQEMYPSNTTTDPNAIRFSTLGNKGPSALEISPFANGQQQRAYVSPPTWEWWFGMIYWYMCKESSSRGHLCLPILLVVRSVPSGMALPVLCATSKSRVWPRVGLCWHNPPCLLWRLCFSLSEWVPPIQLDFSPSPMTYRIITNMRQISGATL
jgi:hypothetical protein